MRLEAGRNAGWDTYHDKGCKMASNHPAFQSLLTASHAFSSYPYSAFRPTPSHSINPLLLFQPRLPSL